MEFIKFFGNALFSEDLDADDESTQYSDDPDSEESSHFSRRRRPSPKKNMAMWADRPLLLPTQPRSTRKQRHIVNNEDIETITLKTLSQDRFYRKDCYAVYLKGEELGLSLLVRLGRVIVKGFTDTPIVLPAQACSMIAIGDELIYVGQIDLSKLDFLHLSEVIAHLDDYAKDGVQLTFRYGSQELLTFYSQLQFGVALQDDYFLDIIGIDKDDEDGDMFAEVSSDHDDDNNFEDNNLIQSLTTLQIDILQFKCHLYQLEAISRQLQFSKSKSTSFALAPLTLTTRDLQLLSTFLNNPVNLERYEKVDKLTVTVVNSTSKSSFSSFQSQEKWQIPTFQSFESSAYVIHQQRRRSRLLSSNPIMRIYHRHIVSLTHDTIRTLLTLPTSTAMWTFISTKIMQTESQEQSETSREKSRKNGIRSRHPGGISVVHVATQRKIDFPALDATYAIYYVLLQNLDYFSTKDDNSPILEILMAWSETFNPLYLWELHKSIFYDNNTSNDIVNPDSGNSRSKSGSKSGLGYGSGSFRVSWSYASSQEEVDFLDFLHIITDLMTLTAVLLMTNSKELLRINQEKVDFPLSTKNSSLSREKSHNLDFYFLPLSLTFASNVDRGKSGVLDDAKISTFISRNISCLHCNIITFLAVNLHLPSTLRMVISRTQEILDFASATSPSSIATTTNAKSRFLLTSAYHELSTVETGVLQWMHTFNSIISTFPKVEFWSLPFSLILVRNVLVRNPWLGVELGHCLEVSPWLMKSLLFEDGREEEEGKAEVDKLGVYYDFLSKFVRRLLDNDDGSHDENGGTMGEYFLQVKPRNDKDKVEEEERGRGKGRMIANELLEVALYLSNHHHDTNTHSAAPPTASRTNPFDSPSSASATAVTANSSNGGKKKRNAYLVCVRGLLLKPLDHQLDLIDALRTCLHYHYHDGCLSLFEIALALATSEVANDSKSDSVEERKETEQWWSTLEHLTQQLSTQLLDDLEANIMSTISSVFKKQFISYLTIAYQLWYHHCTSSSVAVSLADQSNLLWTLVLSPMDRLIAILPESQEKEEDGKRQYAELLTTFILQEHGSHDGQVILQQMTLLPQQLTVDFMLMLRQQGLIMVSSSS